ncbi:MAG: translation initiation factor IF-2 subunit gamma [Candidatus Bathyarchaeia archaeon]
MSELQSKQSLPAQPEVNIGTIGHVDHGKTSLVKALTGVWASRHSEELRRGITIRLGYADAPIYKCPNCNAPECYTTKPVCPNCKTKCEFLRAVSFVDAPGHEALMATMLSGAAIMDGALLVIAADEPCPQPQTREHLAAAEIVGLKNLVIVQNKIDLVDEKRALENYQEIINFVRGGVAEGAPIVPVSSQRDINIDALIQTMEEYIPTPKRDPNLPPIMHVIRSFDINKPGTPAEDLAGGVLGGSISQGKFSVGEEIEIRPGIRVEKGGGVTYEPLFTEIVSLQAGGKKVKTAQCGGLVGVGTLLDPALTKADGLTGNLVGKPNQLPQTLSEFTLEMFLFKQVVGTKELAEVGKIQVRELFLLDVGATITSGTVVSVKGDTVTFRLGRPVCAKEGSRVAVNRKIGGRWRLIGYGILV